MRIIVLILLSLTACGEGEPLSSPDALLPDGARYRGEVRDGLLQGPGRLDYPNGSWFVGLFRDGQPGGHGEWQGAAGERYVGGFRQGLFDGQGRLTYADGSVYQGGFRLGLRDGEGSLENRHEKYSGEFSQNLYHGYGRLQLADGSSFQGRFVRGQPDGVGVRTDADGNRFSGRFSNGQLNGEGSYMGADGDHYVGDFRDDQFHGDGRYEGADGGVWSGRFKQGELSGPGEFLDADGNHYQGGFKRWEYSGKGVLTLGDGSRQSGYWQQGLRVRDEAGRHLPDPLELALLDQGTQLQQMLAAVPWSTPEIELYSLSVAGDGRQSVFLREVNYVDTLLAKRFAARGQISLVNHRDQLAARPMATRESLSRAVRTLASRSGPEDLLFIYLTSHGSRQHEFILEQPRLQLADLSAAELAQILEPLHDRYKVLVISACYSGGFIEPLKDEKTLVITAARADRMSFGCSEEADFTFFGRALFVEALQQTDDLRRAFELASRSVAQREKDERFSPSEPQIWAPEAVLKQWKQLRHDQQKLADVKPSG